MHTLQLIAFAQRIISDQGLQVWGGEEVLIEHLNASYMKVASTFIGFDQGHFSQDDTLTWRSYTSSSEKAKSYPLPAYFDTMRQVILTTSSDVESLAWPGEEVENYFPGYDGYRGFLYFLRGSSTMVLDRRWAQGIAQPATVLMRMYRSPSEFLVGQPEAVIGSTSITLPLSPTLGETKLVADYYKGAIFEVVSGTGTGERFEISAYDKSTRVATLNTDSDVDNMPDTNSIIASVPSLPRRAHELVAYETALDGARIEENVAAASLLQNEVNRRWADIERTMSARQVQASRVLSNSED